MRPLNVNSFYVSVNETVSPSNESDDTEKGTCLLYTSDAADE